ncbi:hypothetical protein [Paenibacillus donghaensis]|uniref:Tyr recombinase domain-containing protein n=1 Tax=Paenibacillus donghaensis TaxID=414771 RepID=A0A2Z2KNC7_9BACL|nr:hypothetical protein [Paenibacillus donghaensis]ASA22692.1 hypothetical protein B9T62_18985 [Paenibacillus donghaensis]
MANNIYGNEFFNAEQKERYLKGLSESTKIVYSRILLRAAYVEEELGRDLYNFNVNEIGQVMKLLSPTTYNSSRDALSQMKKYITWAIKNDLRDNNINPLGAGLSEEFISSFIDSSLEFLYTEKQINDIIGRLSNEQDRALVLALFEGLMGREYSEILRLQLADIDQENNILTLKNLDADGETTIRKLKVSEKLVTLLIRAANQTIYVKSNANLQVKMKSSRDITLVSNGYIFRSADMNTTYFGVAPRNFVSRKIKNISRWLDYKELVPLNIRKSGMVKYAKDLYEERGVFERQEILEVCRRFDYGELSVHRLSKDCLNLKTINRLYPAGTS